MILKKIITKVAVCSITLSMGNASSACDWCCGWGDKEDEPLLHAPQKGGAKPRTVVMTAPNHPPTQLTHQPDAKTNIANVTDALVASLATSSVTKASATQNDGVQGDEDQFERELVTIDVKTVTESDRSGASNFQQMLLQKTNVRDFSVGLWDILAKDDSQANAFITAINKLSEEDISLDIYLLASLKNPISRLEIIKNGREFGSRVITY